MHTYMHTYTHTGKLQLDSEPEGIPIEDLTPHLVETVVNHFGGVVKPAYAEEHKAWQQERAKQLAEEAEAKAAKAAKKAAAAATK